jgi:hypothetical protein
MQEQRKDAALQQADQFRNGTKKVKRFTQNGINAISVHKGHFLILF